LYHFNSFDTNFIICKNVENAKKIFFKDFFVKENKKSFEIFRSILFLNMEFSKLIIQHTWVEVALVLS